MTTEQTPEERALAAVEQLTAEGLAITARAVRERSGVRMTVAAAVAKEHNDAAANQVDVPAPPATVTARFEAIWREAVIAARAEFALEREGLEGRLAAAAAELEDANTTITELEQQAEDLRGELAAALLAARTVADERVQERADFTRELADVRSRADRAEAGAEAVEKERDRLIVERDEVRRQLEQRVTKEP